MFKESLDVRRLEADAAGESVERDAATVHHVQNRRTRDAQPLRDIVDTQ